MVRQLFRKAAVGAVLAAALAASSDAQAGWGSSGGSSGYFSSGSSGSSGSYGSSGGRGFFARWHHRRHHSSGSSGSSGSYGSSGHYSSGGSSGHSSGYVRVRRHHHSSGGSSGYVASHGSSGGSSGYVASSGGSSGYASHAHVSPTYARRSTYSSTPMYAGNTTNSVYVGNSYRAVAPASGQTDAVLAVRVPGDAKIFVNGQLTKTPGEYRRYVSRNLSNGQSYTYEVRAEAEVDGQLVKQTKQATLRAGETVELSFALQTTQPDVLTTRLQLDVPKQAKVFLAGSPTSATGADRVYETRQLKPGETWSDYTIRVEWQREGKTLRRERTITLSAGETKKLSFPFGDNQPTQVAAR